MKSDSLSDDTARRILEQLRAISEASTLDKSAYAKLRKALLSSITSASALRAAVTGITFSNDIGSFLALEVLLDPVLLDRSKNDAARVVFSAHPIGQQLVALAMGLQISRGKWEEQVSRRTRLGNWPLTSEQVEEGSYPSLIRSYVALSFPFQEDISRQAVWPDVGISRDAAAALASLGCPLAKELHFRHLILSESEAPGSNATDASALRSIAKLATPGAASTKTAKASENTLRSLAEFKQELLTRILASPARRKIVVRQLFVHLLKTRVPSASASGWAQAVGLTMPSKVTAKELGELKKQSAPALLALISLNLPQLSDRTGAEVLESLSSRDLSASDRLTLRQLAASGGAGAVASDREAAAAAYSLLESADGSEAVRVWLGLREVAQPSELVQVGSRVARTLDREWREAQIDAEKRETNRIRQLFAALSREMRDLDELAVPWLRIDSARLADLLEAASPLVADRPRVTSSPELDSEAPDGETDLSVLAQRLSQAAVLEGRVRRPIERALVARLPPALDESPDLVRQMGVDSLEFFEVLCSFVATNQSERGSAIVCSIASDDNARLDVWKYIAIRDAASADAAFNLDEALAKPVVDEIGRIVEARRTRMSSDSSPWIAGRVQNETSLRLSVYEREAGAALDYITRIVRMLEETREDVTSSRH
jgi:hypothetical protein